jgi:hypothetical protein
MAIALDVVQLYSAMALENLSLQSRRLTEDVSVPPTSGSLMCACFPAAPKKKKKPPAGTAASARCATPSAWPSPGARQRSAWSTVTRRGRGWWRRPWQLSPRWWRTPWRGGLLLLREADGLPLQENRTFSSAEIIFVGFSKNRRKNNNFRRPEMADGRNCNFRRL